MIHELSEGTRRAVDVVSTTTLGASATFAAVTLNQVALVVTIIAGLLNAAWMILKFIDRHRYGSSFGSGK